MSITTVTQSKSDSPPHPKPSLDQAGGATLLLVAFGAVYLIWGSTYLAIRLGVESFPPLLLAGSRHLIFGLLFYPLLRWKTGIRPTWANWRTVTVTGFLLLFVGNGGVCVAEQTVPSGVTALLVATVSLWMVLIDWLRPGGVRPVARVLIGLLLGFAGLGAAMQSLTGGTVLWIVGWLSGEGRSLHLAAVSTRSWVAMGYLVFCGSMIGFTAYIYILKHSTATRVATYAFVNPVVALFLGWLLLGESITLRTILAAAVILAAVLLVITAPHRQAVPTVNAVPEAAEA
jgi:drug/metabolite transporter (DMT)-like permease